MLRDVVVVGRAHAHAASHFYHEKIVARVSISLHACDPVPIVMGLRLAALWAAGAPLQNESSIESEIHFNLFTLYVLSTFNLRHGRMQDLK